MSFIPLTPSTNLVAINGVVQNISAFDNSCCQQQATIRSTEGISNFIISPNTQVMNNTLLRPGMNVTAFYDANVAIPLIFPPRYQAIFITKRNPNETVYIGNFDQNLMAYDGSLQLNIGRNTEILTSNGQRFNCPLGGHLLIVYYSVTTASLPPQTTPRKIIVVCLER